MKQTLVIVDMQEVFRKAWTNKTIKNIRTLTRLFRARRDPILPLSYTGRWTEDKEQIVPEIERLFRSYTRVFPCQKKTVGGGNEIVKIAKENNLPLSFVLCGVNYSACVKETAEQIAKEGYPCRVITQACGDDSLHQIWGDSEQTVINLRANQVQTMPFRVKK